MSTSSSIVSSPSACYAVLSIENLETLLARARQSILASRGSVAPASCVVITGRLVPSGFGSELQLQSSSLTLRACGEPIASAVDVQTGILASDIHSPAL